MQDLAETVGATALAGEDPPIMPRGSSPAPAPPDFHARLLSLDAECAAAIRKGDVAILSVHWLLGTRPTRIQRRQVLEKQKPKPFLSQSHAAKLLKRVHDEDAATRCSAVQAFRSLDLAIAYALELKDVAGGAGGLCSSEWSTQVRRTC